MYGAVFIAIYEYCTVRGPGWIILVGIINLLRVHDLKISKLWIQRCTNDVSQAELSRCFLFP